MRLMIAWAGYGVVHHSFYLSLRSLNPRTVCALVASNVGAVLIPLWALCTLNNVSGVMQEANHTLTWRCRHLGAEELARDSQEWWHDVEHV
jgi:hypothetical protein